MNFLPDDPVLIKNVLASNVTIKFNGFDAGHAMVFLVSTFLVIGLYLTLRKSLLKLSVSVIHL